MAQRGSVLQCRDAALCTAICTVRCSPHNVDNKELREKTINHVSFSLLQGGILQTELLVTSESSKGLQRAGVDSHFLAQERGALMFVIGLARGAWRFLCRRLGSACNSPSPTQL